jgi:hypothetical protein
MRPTHLHPLRWDTPMADGHTTSLRLTYGFSFGSSLSIPNAVSMGTSPSGSNQLLDARLELGLANHSDLEAEVA